jgi:pectate lyase
MERFIQAVKQYADHMLQQHQQRFEETGVPLFVDGFHAETKEPVTWLSGGEEWTLSNLASQQNWLRVLYSLSVVTGDERYRDTARTTVRYALDKLRYGKLIHWGGHLAYDLKGGRTVFAPDKGPQHELKCHYPFYELLHEVDETETKSYIEAFWNSHVIDWSNLEFSRHGMPKDEPEQGTVWDRSYKGGEPFFTGVGLTFINTGSDLYYAAGMLYRFSKETKALEWAKRLNRRYMETRNPKTGMGGYQFSISVLPGVRGDRAVAQFGEQLKEHQPLEGTLSVARQVHSIVGKAGLCRMVLGESLGEAGKEFTDSAIEDLLAYGRHSYEADTNLIHPTLTNGTRLTGLIMEKSGYYGKEGTALQAMPADPLLLWSYALGYRLSGGRPELWEVVRGIGAGNGLGDFGAYGEEPQVNLATDCANPYAVFALLELNRATGKQAYLELAKAVGEQLIHQGYRNGFFLPSEKHVYAKLDNIAPLALLHLAAEAAGRRDELPAYCGGSAFFGCAYDGIGHVEDQRLFYTRTTELS